MRVNHKPSLLSALGVAVVLGLDGDSRAQRARSRLGLSLVQGIVEKHHGQVTVATAPGGGSRPVASKPLGSP